MNKGFAEACGIVGVWGHEEAANLVYLSLYALQHRGQESAGIVSYDGNYMYQERGMGLVADVFNARKLSALKGDKAVGHVRYSTTGSCLLKNAQPILVDCGKGSIAVAHNGNLVNAQTLRDQLEAEGSIFQSTSDSEVIVHLIAKAEPEDTLNSIVEALYRIRGAYSLVILTEHELIGLRDPHGFRPLCVGKLGDTVIIASESCALDLIDATFLREIQPGEMVIVDKGGIKSYYPFKRVKESLCIFEYIYFARPDSILRGESVYSIRQALGEQLARETNVAADVVIPVPDSGTCAALGYSKVSGIPYEHGLIRNHYVGRTFIEPKQSIRHFGVKIKLNAVSSILSGRRVVVVDDSIIRGTTSRKIIKMVRAAGAKEVHMRISAPPTKYPCFYGIDTPTRKELVASTHTIDEIRRYIGVDTLGYLSIEGMLKVFENKSDCFCTACFSGDYPVQFVRGRKRQVRLFEWVYDRYTL